MKRTKVDSHQERLFLTAMITSDRFLAMAAAVMDVSLLEVSYLQEVARWCINYHTQYGKSPGRHIESIYHSWAAKQPEHSAQLNAVHDFLEQISGEYETAGEVNTPYLLDQLGKFLTLKKASRLRDNLEYALAQADVGEVTSAVQEFQEVAVSHTGIAPLNDKSVWRRVFTEAEECIIPFPGDAGKFLGPGLTRDSLIGVMGPEKRGKTWWCIEFALRALRQRRRVAMFQVGDLSERQFLTRLGVRVSKHPLWKSQLGSLQWPSRITPSREKGKMPRVISKQINLTTTIGRRLSVRGCRRLLRMYGLPIDGPHLMVSILPMATINVGGITAILKMWEATQGFVPDVIIIDYADILAPEDTGQRETRHRINETWQAMRRLSQQYHALVIAPTQTNAKSYDTRTMTMGNFSEDKRKFAHVTGMLGLNQMPDEKAIGVMRLNWVLLREAPFEPSRCLYVGQCLPLGCAFCCASL
jgi:hypothetical protein